MGTNETVNILMVDDQPAKLLSYEVMLGGLGENLIKATSAKQALEVLLKNDVAVVLMDVSMPELDGFQLAAMIRQHPRFQRTAIIFVSAVHLTDLDQLKGYEHGAVDYISVPVVPELLRAKVRVFAELHRKTRQLETLNRELEQRVLERTEELASKAELLLRLNVELVGKNQELDAIVSTAPDVIFSSQGDGRYEYVSERFQEYTGVKVCSGYFVCILRMSPGLNRAGSSAFRRVEVMKLSIACALRTAPTAGSGPVPFPFEIRRDGSLSGTEPAATFTTVRCWNNRFETALLNWKKWSIEGRTNCGVFPSGS
jgi:CheY-like chemotaxis protein